MRRILAAWFVAAGCASGHGDLHESIQAVTEKIATRPEDGALYLQRAALLIAHEDYPAAVPDLDQAAVLGADPVTVLMWRGKLRLATGRFAEACEALSCLLTLQPTHVEALVTRARARAKLRDGEGAVADYAAAITASARPEPEYYLECADVLARAEPPRRAQAVRCLDEGLARLGAGIVTLQLAAVDLEVKDGRFEAALTRIDRAVATAPRKEWWLARRGDVLIHAGRPIDARCAYQVAIAALAALPVRVRTLPATADLEAHLRRMLAGENESAMPAADGVPPQGR